VVKEKSPKMSTNDRFLQERELDILKVIDERKRATVPELAALFEVSETTIRRHLDQLKRRGQIMRTHGGALSVGEAGFEETLESKSTRNVGEKAAIAREARRHISEGETILLGGGTTVLALARLMHDLRDATVLTNNVLVAAELYSNSNIDVCICGGTIRDRTGVIVGREAVEYFSSLQADKAFVGADSLSVEYGITTPNSFEAEIERLLIKKARTAFLLADHTKMDKASISRQTELSELSTLITDDGADPLFIQRLREAGLDVVLCGFSPTG
jgi:DeoR family transcriptional regulator, fructose operon transcriptional repressor